MTRISKFFKENSVIRCTASNCPIANGCDRKSPPASSVHKTYADFSNYINREGIVECQQYIAKSVIEKGKWN